MRNFHQLWRHLRAARPSEDIAKSGAQALALCVPPGQRDYSVALTLQQYGQQSALRKGLR